ncbi:hypothetical protein [Kitasatospora sp. GP82]|uniref:hypothetical protein n=1 Tax=Kitasatospora sp. GP82 TaxID=3035089 RepID=UPI002474D089|nr:hypothetical protein [Kitasatospora sp. GP82]MDH6130064.1 uncharacterized coiled-coil DUF342 family protein [Kitasatospora sp. GP82]
MQIVVESQRFEVNGQEAERLLAATWAAVHGETDAGKSTGFEAMFLAMGPAAFLKSMPAVKACTRLSTTLSIGDSRWRITRNTASSGVEFEHISAGEAPLRLPLVSRDPERPTASLFLLEQLGIPALRQGGKQLAFEHIVPFMYVRQASAGATYLGGMKPELRELAVRAMLGLREDDIEAARTVLREARRELWAARRALAGFEALRAKFGFSTPEELTHRRHQTEQDLARARDAAREAAAELSKANKTLQELRDAAKKAHPAADAADRAAAEAEKQLGVALRRLGEAEGRLAQLRSPDPAACPTCRQRLRTAGLPEHVCPMCKEDDPNRRSQGPAEDERLIAAKKAVEDAKRVVELLRKEAKEARAKATEAHRAVRDAYRAADSYAEVTVEPLRRTVVELEKRVQELAVLAEQLGERVDELVDAIAAQQEAVKRLEVEVRRAAQVLADAESEARERLTDLLKRWSVHFARRMASAGAQWRHAYIAEAGFTPVVNGENFDQVSVAGATLALVELNALVSLREVGREVTGSSVPGLLVVDAALAGLSDAPDDQAVRAYLLDLFAATARGEGPLSQVMTGSQEAIGDVPGGRRIALSKGERYIPGLVLPDPGTTAA